MEAQEYVRYRASVTSLAKGGWTVDATVEIQTTPNRIVVKSEKDKDGVIVPMVIEVTDSVEADVLARLRSFVGKLRAEYPAQVGEK